MNLRQAITDILHKHYYPTMHENIADQSLFDCADEIFKYLNEPCKNKAHNVHKVSRVSGFKRVCGAYHRKDCPDCWQERKKALGVNE